MTLKKIVAAATATGVLAGVVSSVRLGVPTPVSDAPSAEAAFAPLVWNTDVRDNGDGTKTAAIHQKWINYLGDEDQWYEIDPTLVPDGAGWTMDKAPFTFHAPLFADGTAYFASTNRFDIKAKTTIPEDPMGLWMRAPEAAHVQGERMSMGDIPDAVLYPSAFPEWEADLIYYVRRGAEPELQKLVRFNSIPAACVTTPSALVQPQFSIHTSESPDVFQFQGEKTKWNRAKLKTRNGLAFQRKAQDSKRGIGMKSFAVWDSRQPDPARNIIGNKRQLIDVDFQASGTGYLLTKNVPCSFFGDAVFPVFTDLTLDVSPDPNPESTSVDGFLEHSNASWDTMHDALASSGSDDSLATILASSRNDGADYSQRRIFLLFDTSALTASATISAATLDLYQIGAQKVNTDDDGQDYYTVIGLTSPASNTALSTADWDQCGAVNNPTKMSNDIDAGSITSNAINTWTLNATGIANISTTGITKFGMREGHDQEDAPISGSSTNQEGFRSADDASGTDPTLHVTYTVAAPAGAAKRNRFILIE